MPCGRAIAATNPAQHRNPSKAPILQFAAPLHAITCQRINDTIQSQINEETIPATSVLCVPPSLGNPNKAIHGLANNSGEYQTAPIIQIISAETNNDQ